LPVPLSFGVFDSTHALADPTSFEEPLLDTTISIILSNTNPDHLISVTQLGAGHDALLSCIEAAKARCREIVGRDIYK